MRDGRGPRPWREGSEAAGASIPERTATLLRRLEETRGGRCDTCGAPICGHHVLLSLAAGYRDSSLCPSCLAAELGREREGLGRGLFPFLQSRDCYRTAWLRASEDEGVGPAEALACLTGEAAPPGPGLEGRRRADVAAPEGGETAAHAEWDAGDMGCGDLVLELRFRLQALGPGQVLKVRARDPGAREDLPAWCGLTGHSLARSEHPLYWIRKKEK